MKRNVVLNEFFQEYGFFGIEVEGLQFQCCLKQSLKSDGKYIKEISKKDNGWNEGICWEANKAALEKFSEKELLTLIFREARKIGIKVD